MRLRTIAIATTTFALALSLTACGAGNDAATRTVRQVTDGVERTVKSNGVDIKITNALLVATEDGSAVVVATVVNRGDVEDSLLGISAGSFKATLTGQTLLKKNAPAFFEGEQANAKAVFPGVGAEAGRHVTLTFGFARAGLVSMDVIIRDKRDVFAGVTN